MSQDLRWKKEKTGKRVGNGEKSKKGNVSQKRYRPTKQLERVKPLLLFIERSYPA